MAPLSRLTDRLIAAWHERAIVLKAMSFGLVGVVNSAVDFGVFSSRLPPDSAADLPPTCWRGSSP